MAEEWVNKARNEALGAIKEENKDLLSKLTTEERERKSTQAG